MDRLRDLPFLFLPIKHQDIHEFICKTVFCTVRVGFCTLAFIFLLRS